MTARDIFKKKSSASQWCGLFPAWLQSALNEDWNGIEGGRAVDEWNLCGRMQSIAFMGSCNTLWCLYELRQRSEPCSQALSPLPSNPSSAGLCKAPGSSQGCRSDTNWIQFGVPHPCCSFCFVHSQSWLMFWCWKISGDIGLGIFFHLMHMKFLKVQPWCV